MSELYTWTGIDPSTSEAVEVEYYYTPGEPPTLLGRPGYEGDHPGSPPEVDIMAVTPDEVQFKQDHDPDQLIERILEEHR